MLSGIDIHRGDIVLVCFGWSSEFEEEEYYRNYPEISAGFAKKLCEFGASIIGLDTPSPDPPSLKLRRTNRAPYEAHKILFKSDILIIENITNLESLIKTKNFEIIALPAKLEAEAASCRVVAKM